MDAWVEAVAGVSEHWATATAQGGLRPASAARYDQVFGAFSRYAEMSRVRSPETVTTVLCRAFIEAPLRGGAAPCAATRHLRLTVLRSAFRALESAGILATNPTLDLRVHREATSRVPIPLTPPEAHRLLLTGRTTLRDTLRPATCALALLGASHAEIAQAVVGDFRAGNAFFRFGQHGASREVAVPAHFQNILGDRAADQERSWRRRGDGWDPQSVPLALDRPADSYPVNSVAPTVSGNLGRALRFAGIHRAGVRPKSVREYAANALYARTQRIEAVAEQLGLSSYDTAARLIDREWQARWGDVPARGRR